MRRNVAMIVVLFAAGSLFALSPGDRLAVSIREGHLRSAPGFLSASGEGVAYGEAVTVLAVNGSWARVRVDERGAEGWMHDTAILPPREMHLEDAARRGGDASTREIALAGRGFSEQVEREYEAQQALDFAPVDAMEGLLVALPELGDFLNAVGAGISGEVE
jgi:hypothetical protein